MQKSILALGVVAIAILAAMPAHSAQSQQTYPFQFDVKELSQPGAMWSLSIDSEGNFAAKVIHPGVEIVPGFGTPDACVTAAPAVMSCTGATGPHTGAYRLLDSFGVYNAALGATDVDVGLDYGATGKTTWRCHFNSGGGVIGIFFFPPGSGFCYYASFHSFTGSWNAFGAQSGAGVVGPVEHLVL